MMNKILIFMALFLLQSCIKSNECGNIAEDVRSSEVKECHIDSIGISISEGNDLNHLILNIHNTTTDTVNISPVYCIGKDQENDSCLLIGDIADIPSVLKPGEKFVCTIGLGLDSIEYSKRSEYIITIRGNPVKKISFSTKNVIWGIGIN